MAQNPHERYESASDFREALRRLGRSNGAPVEGDSASVNEDFTFALTEVTTFW
jgi:hypothetical protein